MAFYRLLTTILVYAVEGETDVLGHSVHICGRSSGSYRNQLIHKVPFVHKWRSATICIQWWTSNGPQKKQFLTFMFHTCKKSESKEMKFPMFSIRGVLSKMGKLIMCTFIRHYV